MSHTHLSKAKRKNFFIVGIGASAGGLEAILQLLSQLPNNLGIAFVIVQHLDPAHASLSVDIISRKTKMSVKEIRNSTRVLPNHIYIIPPNHNLTIFRNVLKLSLIDRMEMRPHMVIDNFFRSLADDQKNYAIGIILSGIASDGTKGLEAIKMKGGLTIVQEPTSAKFDGMPRNAIAAGVVDLVLTPQKIAKELISFNHHQLLSKPEKVNEFSINKSTDLKQNTLIKIFALLQSQTKIDFTHYKHTTLKRRITRRMLLVKKETLDDYLTYLQSSPKEVQALFNDFLINVTEFFRDPEVFTTLKKQIFPKIIKNKPANSFIRIWIVGCASGEEVYSLAIILLELLEETKQLMKVQIFATDISDETIQKARAGIYPESIRKNVSKQRLKRFFVKVDNGYRIAKFIRDICLFSKHNIITDIPFAKIDLISCRNLLIYFDATLQKHIMPILHYALNPNGFLCLGRSESVGKFTTLFRIANKNKKIYSRTLAPALPQLQLRNAANIYIPEKLNPTVVAPRDNLTESSILQQKTEQLLLAEYAPPGVVINDDMEIVLANGNTAPYLTLPQGKLSLNLFKMLRQEIIPDVRMLIQAAKKQKNRVKKSNLSIHDGNRNPVFFNIIVIPLQSVPNSMEHPYLILFESITEMKKIQSPLMLSTGSRVKGPLKKALDLKDREIQSLNRQLVDTRQYQQSIIEDYETAQEEVISVNEELQSTNEEFQSANEELETAKEELQSANEELTTLNDELQSSNKDLTKLNNDLVNLFGIIDIPIIMLDGNTRIRQFTPSAAALLNLTPADLGHRLVRDIKHSFYKIDLQKLVSESIETVTAKEQEANSHDGRCFRLNVKPVQNNRE